MIHLRKHHISLLPTYSFIISEYSQFLFLPIVMAPDTPDPAKITGDLIHLLEVRGTADYIGESISQLEHCLQAANFAFQAGMYAFQFPKSYFDTW